MLVSEIFLSIQGESSFAGFPCVFVRLAGCNLACSWCDTEYARSSEGATEMTVDEVVEEVKKYRCSLVEITGGEPLMQSEAVDLAARLLVEGYDVLIETNGSVSLEALPEEAVKIVDVKCPSSGHAGSFLMDNLERITGEDEVKFVIADREDYEYAKRFAEEFVRDRTESILFAPVVPELPPKELADWILKDGIRVRLQVQIHKYIWNERRGR